MNYADDEVINFLKMGSVDRRLGKPQHETVFLSNRIGR